MTTTEIAIANTQAMEQRKEFFDQTPKNQVIHATEMANVLSDVIEKQGLFSNIQGKKYIKAEGWQTLGTFLGVTPRERYVKRLEDGSYEAYVEIVKFRDGTVVGGASAICSRDEKRWARADEYAVRSMAITRAQGKAYRVGFAWIVTLAGYAPTNAEEMPEPTPSKHQVLEYDGDEIDRNIKVVSKPGYDPHNKAHQDVMMKVLASKSIPEDLWDDIGNAMAGRPNSELDSVIKKIRSEKNV